MNSQRKERKKEGERKRERQRVSECFETLAQPRKSNGISRQYQLD